MKYRKYIIPAIAVLIIALIVYQDECAASTSEADRVVALSRIWSYAKDYYGCWELTDESLDWDQEYERAIDKMKKVSSEYEVMSVLDEFRALMKDGHGDYSILFSKKNLLGEMPFHLDYIENQYVISDTLVPDQFPIGAIVEKINGMQAEQFMEQTVGKTVGLFTPLAREFVCGQKFHYGEKGEKVELTLKHIDGSSSVIKTSWQDRTGKWKTRQYRESGRPVYDSAAFKVYFSEEKICHVVARTFETMDVFKEFQTEVMPIVRESHGVIMDLRSNSGGMTAVGKSILKCFYSTELPEFQMKSAIKINNDIAMSYIFGESMRAALPSYSDVYKEEKNTIDEIAARGRRMYEGKYVITMAQYDKIMEILGVSESPETDEAADIEFCGVPCVILINHKSGSAIDSTAAIAKSAGVPMIGTRTKGATGNIAKFDLGSGYTLTISTDYDFTPEGKAINNCGIEADIYVEQSLEDERRLIDSQLEYAKSYLLNP